MKCTHLVFRVQRDHTSFVRTYNRLACLDHIRTRLALKLVCNKQQQKASLQEVDSKQPRHERDVRIAVEYLVDRFGSRDRMPRSSEEGLARDPEVVVVKQRDGIPFAVEEDVERVHEVRAVSDDRLRLEHGFVMDSRRRGRRTNLAIIALGYRREPCLKFR